MQSVSSQGTFCARKKRGEEGKIGRKLSDHKLNRRSDTEWLNLKHLDKGQRPYRTGVHRATPVQQHTSAIHLCSVMILVR